MLLITQQRLCDPTAAMFSINMHHSHAPSRAALPSSAGAKTRFVLAQPSSTRSAFTAYRASLVAQNASACLNACTQQAMQVIIVQSTDAASDC